MRALVNRISQFSLRDLSSSFWIIVVLLASGFIGLVGGFILSDKPVLVLVLGVLPLGAIFLLRSTDHPEIIPVVLLFAAAFTPFYLPTGTMSIIVDGMILAGIFFGLWLFRMLVTSDASSFRLDVPSRWLLAFMLVVPISLVWSNLLRDVQINVRPSFVFVQLATSAVMILLPACFLMVANFVNKEIVLKWMVGAMMVAGGLGLLTEILRPPDTLRVNTGGLFTMWILCLSAAMVLYNAKLGLVTKVLLLSLALAWIYFRFILNTTWLAGWLPGFITLGVLVFMRSKRLFLLLLVVIAIFTIINIEEVQIAFESEQRESGYSRTQAWLLNLDLARKHWLFGTGPGGYRAYYEEYYPSSNASHNNYLDILSAVGVVGFIPFMAFFVTIAWKGYKLLLLLKKRRNFLSALAAGAFAGTIGCLFAMAFGDWVIPFPYTQGIWSFDYEVYSWLFMGAILAIERIVKNEENTG